MPELYEKRMLQIIWNKIFRLDVIKQNHIRFKEELFIGEDFRFLLEYMQAAKITDPPNSTIFPPAFTCAS